MGSSIVNNILQTYGGNYSSGFTKHTLIDVDYFTGHSLTIGGSNQQIQVNNSGNLAGYSTFSFNPSTKKLNIDSTLFYSPTGTTDSVRNIFIGNSSGVNSPSHGYNVGIGDFSLNNLSSGQFNVGIGFYSLYGLTSAQQNTAIGYLAMGNGYPITGNGNVAIGRGAASNLTTGSLSVIIGDAAAPALTGGTQNTLIGRTVAQFLKNGNDNTIIGFQGGNNLTGSSNTLIGSGVATSTVKSHDDVIVGFQTAQNYKDGYENTVIGSFAFGESNLRTSESVVIGARAWGGYGQGGYNLTGVQNVVVGNLASGLNVSGSQNIIIGYRASSSDDPTVAITGGSQNVVIGYRANVASAIKDGQLSIQNAIYGSGNTLNITGDAIAKGNIGFYFKTPSARVHFPAGSTTAGSAPIKIESGSLMTTSEPNAIENNGNHLYWSNSGGTRYQLDKRTDIRVVTANTTINIYNELILVDTSSSSIIVTLPSSVPDGKWFTIKDKSNNASVHNITVNGNGFNIDGGSSSIINTNYGGITVTFSSVDNKYYVTGFVN